MVSVYNLVPFLQGTNPVIPKFFRAFVNAVTQGLRCWLYRFFPTLLAFFETILPRLFCIKSPFWSEPTVLAFVPFQTCLREPLTETRFLRRATRRLATRRFLVARLFLVTRLRAVRRFLETLRRLALRFGPKAEADMSEVHLLEHDERAEGIAKAAWQLEDAIKSELFLTIAKERMNSSLFS